MSEKNNELTLEGLKQQLDALQLENQDLKKQIGTLASAGPVEAAKNEEPTIPTETFKVGKREYKFLAPKFILPGKGQITALEALSEKSILEELVKRNSDIIQEVA